MYRTAVLGESGHFLPKKNQCTVFRGFVFKFKLVPHIQVWKEGEKEIFYADIYT
jgi:hypothetical protein